MASIFEKKNRKGDVIGWQVQVRKRGFPVEVKTFDSYAEAQNWATVIESEMVRKVYKDRSKAERTTFRDVIDSYIRNVAPQHKGARDEILRLQRFVREESKLVAHALSNLTTEHFEHYRDLRLQQVSASTVKRELGLLHSVLETVRRSHGMVDNPVSDVRRPQVNDARSVRLHGDDEGRLLAAIKAKSRNPWIYSAVVLAIETGMRRSELLSIKWDGVSFDDLSIHIEETKTDGKRKDRLKGRDVPMSPRVYELLWDLAAKREDPDAVCSGQVLGTSAEGIKSAFERVRVHAGLEHLNFHDLRHEATSRLFERGWGVMDVAAVTGHQDIQMLKRYTNLRAKDLARKME